MECPNFLQIACYFPKICANIGNGCVVTLGVAGDDIADAQVINDLLEKEIRLSPAQYLWIHRRFKTQREGEKASLYK